MERAEGGGGTNSVEVGINRYGFVFVEERLNDTTPRADNILPRLDLRGRLFEIYRGLSAASW